MSYADVGTSVCRGRASFGAAPSGTPTTSEAGPILAWSGVMGVVAFLFFGTLYAVRRKG